MPYPQTNLHKTVNLTASGVGKAEPGILWGLTLAGGSDVSTVIVYDHASAASGTILLKIAAPIGDTTNIDLTMLGGLKASLGLYISITGTDPNVTVLFD